MKSYEVIKEEDRRDWSPNLKIEDIIAELPKESNAQLIYKTEVESNWNDFTEVENFNFVSDAWEIKNKADIVKVLNNKPQDSSFKFKILIHRTLLYDKKTKKLQSSKKFLLQN